MAHKVNLKRAGALACSALVGGALLFGGAAIAPTDQGGPAGQPVPVEDSAPAAVTPAFARSAKVYIAPHSGKKYHRYRNCRGLRRARSVKKVSVKTAKRQHYKKCKICWR